MMIRLTRADDRPMMIAIPLIRFITPAGQPDQTMIHFAPDDWVVVMGDYERIAEMIDHELDMATWKARQQ